MNPILILAVLLSITYLPPCKSELLIGFTQNVTVMESNNATLCVNFSSEFKSNFRLNVEHLLLNLTFEDEPATPGEDFNLPFSIEANFTIHDPNNSLCFNIFIVEDEFVEYKECFKVGIRLPDSVSDGLKVEISEGKDTTVVCIKDNDFVEIGFEETEVQVPENITDGVWLLCVKVFEGELMRETTVTVKYNDKTAVLDKDYKIEIFPLTFSQNDTRVCFNVSIIDDSIHEGFEDIYVEIITSDPQVILTLANLTLSIEDNDELLIRLPQNVTVMEGDNATLCVYFSSEFKSNFNIDVRHLLSNSTLDDEPATPEKDFDLSNFSIEAISTVHGPDNSLCFDILIVEDEFVEYKECFEVGISLPYSVSGLEIAEGKDTSVVYIDDNDSVVIGFEETEVQVSENITDGMKLLCVKVFQGKLMREVTVIARYYNQTVDADEDYKTEKVVSLTFSQDDTRKCFNVSIIEDSTRNQDEVYVNITTSDLQVTLSPNMTTLTTESDDDFIFSFGEHEYSFDENMGNATITVKKVSGSIDQAITLTVSGFVQGELINKTIIFGPNDTEIPITFEITDDVIPLEPTEEFELSLKGTDTEYNLLFEPNDKTTIYIVDDDGEHDEDVCLSTPTSEITIYVVVVGKTFEEVCDNQHLKDFLNGTIYSEFKDISKDKCHLNPDYQASCNSLSLGNKSRTAITIKGNMTCGSSCIQHTYCHTSTMEINRQEKIINEISLLTLKKHRYNQTNDVNIRYFYGEKNPVFYKPVFYTCEREETSFVQVIRGKNLTLCNCSMECEEPEEDVTFSFGEPEYSFVETMGNATIHVEKTSGSIDRVITLLVTGFAEGPQTVDFYPQDIEKAITFKLFDDKVLEPTEKIELLLFPTDRTTLIKPHDKTTINITLKENVVNIVFIGGPFEDNEESRFVAITVGVMEPEKLKTMISVNLTTKDIVGISNPATAAVDYRPLDETLTFSESVTYVTVNVTLLDDNALEGDEDFKAQLSKSSGSNVVLPMPEAIVTIIDDDRVTIGFEEETVQVHENIRNQTLCVNASLGQLARTTVVNVSYQDQTAINGKDYSARQMTFTFSKDNTQKCFDVSILDNNINEPEKKFLVMLTTGDPEITLSPDTAVITIIDNDGVNIVFIGDPFEGREDSRLVAITIGVVEPEKLKTEVSVNLTTKDIVGISNAATAGVDYTPLDETLTFSKTVTNITVNVTLLDDNGVEGDEDFKVLLSTGSGSNVELPMPDTIVTIVDDDRVTIGFEEEAIQVPESNRNQTLCVNVLLGQLLHTTTVNISYLDQTAINGQDFSAQQMTFIFSKNNTRMCFDVDIFDDDISEPEHKFFLMLTTGDPQVNLSPNTTVITTIDNDVLLIGLTENVTVMEGNNARLCVNFSDEFEANFKINVSHLLPHLTLDDPATPGEDFYLPISYIEANSTVHGLNSSLCFNLFVMKDGFVEYDECFEVGISVQDSVSDHHKVEISEGKETAFVCIKDNDSVMIGFEETEVQVPESITDRVKLLCVKVLEGKLMREATAIVKYNDQIVFTGEDYNEEMTFLTFSQNDTRVCFNVSIIYDNIQEQDEVFLANITTSDPQVILSQPLTTLTIKSDDVTFSFGEPEYTFIENMNNATINVDRVNGFTDRTIALTVSGLVQGELINKTIIFGPNDTERAITFEITDDVIPLEPTEKFEISLKGTDTEYNLLFEPNDKTTINIVDDDGEHDEDVCLSTPTSEITIYVVVVGKTANEACDNQRLMDFLERTIYSEFTEISKDKCHLKSDYQASCEPLALGNESRTAITIKVNMTCGSSCIQHTYRKTSTMEINRQEKYISEISVLKLKKHRYNQTNDVNIRYFYGEKKTVFYTCEREETSFVQVIGGKNLTLCNCSMECEEPEKDVTFSFGDPEYNFDENLGNATITVQNVNGSIDRVITLLVTGFAEGPQTVDFYPQDTEKAITFKIFEDKFAKKIELLLSSTDRITLIKPHYKTTINIKDVVKIVFIDGPFEGKEMEGFVAITVGVMEPEKLKTEVSVNLTTKNIVGICNAATAGIDYTPLDRTLMFSETVTNITVNVTLLDDNDLEGDEDFRAQLSTSLGSNVKLPRQDAIVTIVDDDNVNIIFIGAPFEGKEVNGFVAITVGVMEPEKLKTEVSVNLTTKNIVGISNAATTGIDYIPLDRTLMFNETVTNITVNVTLLDDNALEGDEDFRAQLSTSSGSNAKLPRTKAILTIVDDDRVTIGFEEETVKVHENIRNQTLCVNVSLGQLARTTTVSVSYQDQTAINDQDYSAQQMTFTFAKDNTTRMCFDVKIFDDNINEPEKKFLVILTTGDPQVTLSPATAVITIIDNDVVNIVFIGDPFNGREENGFVAITVGVVEPEKLKTTISVNLTTKDIVDISNAATASVDYRPLDEILTFSETVSNITVNVILLNDNALESDEYFRVQLSTSSGSNVGLPEPEAIVTIVDKDMLLIGLTQNVTVMEGNNVRLCVHFSSEFASNFKINVSHLLPNLTLDDPATPGEDFDLPISYIEANSTVHGPNSSLCFNVFVMEDGFVEYDECFEVSISLPYSVSDHLKVEISEGKETTFVCIKDNDTVVIGFEETEVQVLENITDRIKLLCVKVLKGKLTREATVTVKYNDQTVVTGKDYNEDFLTFSQNDTRVCFNVSIIYDNIQEQDEVFLANITTSDPQVILSQPLATLTVKSDDVTFSFGEPEYTFIENMNNATINVDRVNGFTDRTIALTVSGSIQGEPINETITFGPNDTKKAITFEITDDVIPLEPTEEFELSLKGTNTEYNLLFEPNNKTIIYIVDDDGEHDEDVCLSTPTSEITIYVVVVGKTAEEVCDNQHLKDFLERTIYSEIRGISKDKCHLKPDYQASCEPLLLKNQSRSRTNITIKTNLNCGSSCIQHTYHNTSILEINRQEKIINEINNTTRKQYKYNQTSDVVIRYFYGEKKPVFYACEQEETSFVQVIGGKNLTLCNCSEECGDPVKNVTFSFGKPEYNFDETIGNATITVQKISGSIDQVITLLVTGFAQGLQTVDFFPQDTEKAITFKIFDDKALELTEKIELLLSPTDRITLIEPHGKTTVNIIMEDDVVNIVFIGDPFEGREVNGFVAITVGVMDTERLITEISVNITTEDIVGISNAATAGVDYKPLDETLTFSGNVTNITINVTLLDDNDLEGNEDFKAQLSISSGSNVGLPDPDAIITIVDDDRVTIGFEEETVQVLEDIRNHTLCINVLLGQLLRTTTVNVSYQDQTAINGEDYSNMTFIFSKDNTRMCFNVDILNDNVNEPEKIFQVVLTTGDPQITLSPDTAVIIIIDNDNLLIGLNQNVTAMEGNNAVLCVDFSSEFELNFMIHVRHLIPNLTLDDPATPGEDFDLPNFSIEAISAIHSPNNSLCFNIFVIEDDFVEYEECFEVGISLPYSVSNHLMVEISEDKDTAVVCIKDNDSVVIGFEETEVQVPENITDGVNLLCAKVFEGKLMREATVTVKYYDVSDENYKEETIFLTFSQDDTRVCFNVSIIDDNIHGVFFVNITTSDPQVTLSPHLTNLTIKSDDVVNIVFIDGPFEGREINGSIAITVGVMDPEKLKSEVSVNLTTKNIVGISNAATAGVDYKPLDETLVFSETVTVITVNITIFHDNALEGDEDFKAWLSTSSGSNVGLSMPEAIATIVDDDRVTIGFEEETVQVPENISNQTLCVNVSHGQLARNTVVSVSYQDQTAINGQDYSAQQMNFTFSKDNTRLCYNFDTLDDDINELEKKFFLMLIAGDPQVTISPNKTVITIKDNDDLLIGLTRNVTVMEGYNATLCVHFTSGFESNFRIHVRHLIPHLTLDDPATPGEDFIVSNFSIEAISTIHGLNNSLCFNIFVMEDEFVEHVECFKIGISLPYSVSGREIDEGKNTAVVCIKDNDNVTFSFAEPVYNFDENMGNATITVEKISGSIDQAITLTVSGFVHGELINKIITFGPKDTEIYITFKITDDVIPLEPTEKFELSLNGTDTEFNVLFEPNDKTTIYIVDDDGEHDEDVCLSIPTSEITIPVVVVGKTADEVCDNQHLMDFLQKTIHSDFREISKDQCHFKPDYQSSCNPLVLKGNAQTRTAITIKTNIICGSSCIQHIYHNTSMLEIKRQEKAIKEISIFKLKKHKYNKTIDVNIRYFSGEKKPLFYTCDQEETSFVQVIGDKNLTLCNCSMECKEPEEDVAFSFNKSVYNFYENMSNATIYVEKTSGSIVRVITLLVTGFAQGPKTIDFYPQDTIKAITLDDIALKATEKIELLLSPTDRITLIKPHNKTTINIMDDDD